MLEILVAFAACALGQTPQPTGDGARARAVAHFVDPDVVAVVQLDLARVNIGRRRCAWRAIARPAWPPNEQAPVALTEGLRQAGAQEVYVVVSLDDLPGLPVLVAPLIPGSDAARIGRLLWAEQTQRRRRCSRRARPSTRPSWPGRPRPSSESAASSRPSTPGWPPPSPRWRGYDRPPDHPLSPPPRPAGSSRRSYPSYLASSAAGRSPT